MVETPCHWIPCYAFHTVQIFRNWIIQRCLQSSFFKISPGKYLYEAKISYAQWEQLCFLGPFTLPWLDPKFLCLVPLSLPPFLLSVPITRGALPCSLAAVLLVPVLSPSNQPAPPRACRDPPPQTRPRSLLHLIPLLEGHFLDDTLQQLPLHTLAPEAPSLDGSFPLHLSPSNMPSNSNCLPPLKCKFYAGRDCCPFCSLAYPKHTAWRTARLLNSDVPMNWWINTAHPGGMGSLAEEVSGLLDPGMANRPEA